MKKFMLVLLGGLLALPIFASSFNFTYKGRTLTYDVISEEDKTVSVRVSSDNNSFSGGVEIPATVLNEENMTQYSVTSIRDYGFYCVIGLTSITIPNSVTSIGDYAFYACSELTSITIPNSVTSIGEYAFNNCTGLTSLTIPDSITYIREGTFGVCSSLTSLTIPNSVTSIGVSAFSVCSSLTSLTIPNSVTSIGDSAFSGCSGLTSITIPNSVTSIGDYAFYSCTGLTSITIPISINSIGDRAFEDCIDLTSVYYGADKPITANYNIFNDVIYGKATLYVSDEGASLVGNINPWNNFKNIQIYDFSGIEEITVDFDEDTPYEVFNLNGVMVGDSVDNLAPGLYIVRQGNVTKKISVK